MQQPAYKRKLAEYNQLIQIQRNNVAKFSSKVISNAQNVHNSNSKLEIQPPVYTTPAKKTTTNNTTGNNTTAQTNKQPSMFILSPTNQSLNPTTTEPTAQQILKKQKQQQELQKQKQKQRELQRQREIQRQKQRQRQRQKQRQQQLQRHKQRQKQFQFFLTSSHKLNILLQQKSKFIDIQYEKQRIYWNDQRLKYQNQIDTLNNQISQKNQKIREMIQKIAELKQQLKAALEKCQQQAKIIVDLRDQNSKLKQQNIEIKLQNKNLKADNKVVISHLDKLFNQKIKNNDKTARQIFQQRQKRVIQSLYIKTHTTYPNSPSRKQQILPSQRHQLTNRVKLQNVLQQYQNHRQQSNRMIAKLQQQLSAKQKQCESYKRRNQILQQNMKKVNQLRDIQRDASKKQKKIIAQYQEQFSEIRKYNEDLTVELEKYWRMPIVKEKVGFIAKVKKFKQYPKNYQ